MFIQLPSSKAIIDLRTIKRVGPRLTEGLLRWEMVVNVGGTLQSEIDRLFINDTDYGHIWIALESFNKGTK